MSNLEKKDGKKKKRRKQANDHREMELKIKICIRGRSITKYA